MEKQVSFITRIKVRIYLGALSAGIVITLGVWGLDRALGNTDPFSRVVLPILTGLYAIPIYWIHKQDERFIRYFERLIYAASALYILGFFTYNTILNAYTGALDLNKFFLWMVMLYAAPFLMFSSRTALRLSVGSYGYVLAVGIWFLVNAPRNDSFGQSVSVVFQVLIANLLYIIILSVIVNLKDKVLEAETRSMLMDMLANTDPLTGIHNRRKLTDTIVSLIQEQVPFSVIMVDIDRFKHINDTYGHDAGDKVLQYFGSELGRIIRRGDLAGRWGGDEFLIICPNLGASGQASLLQRLNTIGANLDPKVAQPFHLSFGLAECAETDTLKTLLKRADMELYQNKSGKQD